jgi:hypothetical protein
MSLNMIVRRESASYSQSTVPAKAETRDQGRTCHRVCLGKNGFLIR